MLVACADTHGRESARLEGRTETAVAAADVVVHAGDFTTVEAFEDFRERCELRAVYGNNDPPALRERLPPDRVVEWRDLRVFVTHGHGRSGTALAMAGRQANADLVVVGHSHDPGFEAGTVPVCNPGSHADPRWNRPAHAELEWDESAAAARGRLVAPDGEAFETFEVRPRPVDG